MPRRAKPNQSPPPAGSSNPAGRFSYHGLDRVIHEKARLGILASLSANADGVLFNDLKQLCSLTDGNLSRHLGVLSEAGLIEIWKATNSSRPQTMVRLTAIGRERFAEYISVLEKVVADTHSKVQQSSQTNQAKLSGGWSPA
ncbi:transcriptional regulator [Planctomycetaceae bacterium SH139]